MKNIDKFLSKLNDNELAIFVAYRFDDFLENSKKKIVNEIKRRNITHNDLQFLLEEGLTPNKHADYLCPRCYSDKYFLEKELVGGRVEYEVETYRCRVCGFNPEKEKISGFRNKLKKFFGFYKISKIKRYTNSDNLFN